MSNRYKGGIISATPPTTTGGESGTASGAWTLEQQMQAQAAGLWPAQPTGPYIEDVFSTWLYTGATAPNTIPNGIDLAGKGGLVWLKGRGGASQHRLVDTVRGRVWGLSSDSTSAQLNGGFLDSFNSNGFSLGVGDTGTNAIGNTYVSWTFREQPKFFDVVTYTGNGASQTINHNLGATPGCVIIKCTSTAETNWSVWHRGTANPNQTVLRLNTTAAAVDVGSTVIAPNSTGVFLPNADGDRNVSGATYVMYLFAHNAGGFGLSGTDNVISCGSFTVDGSGNATVNLGYEPQWVMVKASSTTSNWEMYDSMRGLTATSASARLYPNLSSAEGSASSTVNITSTGFGVGGNMGAGEGGATYIYIAIRRGPMRTPTTGTSVFAPLAVNNASNTVNTTGFPVDLQWYGNRDGNANNIATVDRLRGVSTNSTAQQNYLRTASTAAEVNSGGSSFTRNWSSTGFSTAPAQDGANAAYWNFRRAPGFFDEVCYTGTGVAGRTVNHNLGVVPELIFIKCSSAAVQGLVYNKTITASRFLTLFSTSEGANASEGPDSGPFNSTEPTSSVFSVGTYSNTNGSGSTYVAYLFATCPGVSKVGSYTGTGTTQTIDCGFTGGARFVMIKRADSTGAWYVWDTARGMIPANDPYLLLNSTAAEVTGTDFVDTAATGFEITSTAPAAINASGGTFIFLAIA